MRTRNEHGAGGPLLGFVYQVYYFLYQILTIKEGAEVSLEKIEDVAVETGEKRVYYQLKHTIGSTVSKVKRMSNRDTDLWKTLSMWVDIIKKEEASEDRQQLWIAGSEFVIVSNKTPEHNRLFELIEAYRKDDGKWDELEAYLNEQTNKEPEKKKEGDKENKKNIYYYMRNVNDYALKKELLKHVTAEFESDDDVKKKIDWELENKSHVRKGNVENLRNLIMGRLVDKIEEVGGVATYTGATFHAAFGPLFQEMRERRFVPTPRDYVLPDKPLEQTFIRQLRDIGDRGSRTMSDVIRLTRQMIEFGNDYHHANKTAGRDVQNRFEKNVKTRWKNAFDSGNEEITVMSTEEEINKAARAVVKEVRGIDLKYDGEDMEAESSNGCFYYFSDGKSPRIGWRDDWQNKYHGQEWTID